MKKSIIDLVQRSGVFIRRYQRYFIGVVGVLALVIIIQAVYPGDRTLPNVHVAGINVGSKSRSDVQSQLQSTFSTAPLQVRVADKKIDTTLTKAGIGVDYQRTAEQTTAYPWWQRLIPFSSVVIMATRDTQTVTFTNQEPLASLATSIVELCRVDPVNASLKVEGEKLALVPSKDGAACDMNATKQQLSNYQPVPRDNTITVAPKVAKPARNDDQVTAKINEAQQIIDRPLSLSLASQTVQVEKSVIASWLSFPEDEKTKQISIGLNPEAVAAYLQQAQKSVYIAPGRTVISVYDGTETGRTVGAAGRGIDTAATTASIEKQLLVTPSEQPVPAVLTALAPVISYNRGYSNTQRGLEVLLQDIADEKGGYGISVIELAGQKRSASGNGSKKFTTASTYKVFVAYSVLKRVEAGQLKWTDQIANGRDAAKCFDDMIVKSDNPCAEAFGKLIGWSTVQSQMRGLGLSNTSLGTEFKSTAYDETLFMKKLEQDNIVSAESKTRLFDAMKRQVYRTGIPAGVNGAVVADKVGFLEGYLNDTAVVYSPKGTYVITIMSFGSSWSQIADATRRINTFLNQ